jgi:hypothetical protein
MADCMIEEFERWRDGVLLRYEITRDVFATMA